MKETQVKCKSAEPNLQPGAQEDPMVDPLIGPKLAIPNPPGGTVPQVVQPAIKMTLDLVCPKLRGHRLGLMLNQSRIPKN